jgi:hypothetical protein
VRKLVLGAAVCAACSQAVQDDAAGWDDPAAPALSPFTLVINEVAAAGDPEDWFEVVNTTREPLALDGYDFGEEVFGTGARAPFTPGLVLEPGERHVQVVTDEAEGFQLGADEELGVRDARGGFVDGVDWGEGDSPEGGSFARVPDVDGDFQPTDRPTPGLPNG